MSNRKSSRNNGSVMILAMVVLFALAGLVLTLNRGAYTDMALAANISATRQADSIERGAEQYAIAILTDYKDTLADLTDNDFAQVPVGDGYFWITRPTYGDATQSPYGFLDESSKLNLNSTTVSTYATLRNLPGMTDEIAASIVDWRDTDDDISESNGAESNSYSGLSVSYRAKNADFDSVEELQLVKGMTPALMYGDAQQAENGFTNDYYLANGLVDFFTVWSTQATPTSTTSTSSTSTTGGTSTQRINVNDQGSRAQLRDLLNNTLGTGTGDSAVNQIGRQTIVDVFQFIEVSGLTTDQVSQVEGNLSFTATQGGGGVGAEAPTTPVRGLVNINTAPKEVLIAITADTDNPMTDADAQSLIASRPVPTSSTPPSMAWVYDVLKEKAIGLGSRVCAQGNEYSFDVVAVNKSGRAFKRVRVVIDASASPVRVVYRRDITARGWPLDPQILSQLRAGQGVTSSGSNSSALGGLN